MIIEKIKKRKLLTFLLIIMLISCLGGIFFISLLSDANKELVKSSINGYFKGISSNEISYLRGLYTSLSSNLLSNLFLWIMGISIIGVVIAVLFLIIRGFLVAFSFTSIIYTYGFKGIVVGLIYILPNVLELFVMFVVSYYAISFSFILFNYLFRKKDYNKRMIVTRYLKILLLSIVSLLIISLISVFFVPFVLRMF